MEVISPPAARPACAITSFHSPLFDHNDDSWHQYYQNCRYSFSGTLGGVIGAAPQEDYEYGRGYEADYEQGLRYQENEQARRSQNHEDQGRPRQARGLHSSRRTTTSKAQLLQSFYDDRVVCDIGSGTGRLVAAAAALHPRLHRSRGVEVLEKLHGEALDVLRGNCFDDTTGAMTLPLDLDLDLDLDVNRHVNQGQGHAWDETEDSSRLPMAPVDLHCADVTDPSNTDLRDVDVAFVFSTCMPPDLMGRLAQAAARQMLPRTVLVTIDQRLPQDASSSKEWWELVHTMDGSNALVGGTSTAFVYQRRE